jgi:serine/threonine protein kinase/WD40 repeat protein
MASVYADSQSMKGGQKLGSYEIVSAIGAGGMGEVYRARDPRLGRDVAIKILPALYAINNERLQRFEQEARAAGMLNHPNLLTVFELGVHDDAPYIVTELLEGETLRARMDGGSALAPRKVIDYTIQIASGLAAAHEKGVVHRDLKPENLFLTTDGRVKILDFGLAKLATPAAGELGDIETMKREKTAPGTVMGTVGYMAPEQVRGQAVDHRADLFSLGAVMYEMLSGRRAFQSSSSIETLNAILKDDPPELSTSGRMIPPALQRIVEHSLEKNPESRFQSARDLAFHLEAISSSDSGTSRSLAPARKRRVAVPLLIAAAIALAGAASFIAASRMSKPKQPSLRQLSFLRGTIRTARFAPDGQTIIYGAAIAGRPIKIFQTRLNDNGSAPMSLPDGDILSIAPNGELAVSVGRTFDAWTNSGTLATASILGGVPRQVLEHVSFADYSPDGTKLAAVRRAGDQDILEYPIGKPLLRTRGYFSHIRVSPDGRQIAFLDHPIYGDNRGDVKIVDESGTTSTLVEDWGALEGLAWSPDGKEVWFTGDNDGTVGMFELYGVDRRGNVRTVWSVPGSLQLLDVAKGGRVLVAGGGITGSIRAATAADPVERDLSTPSWTTIADMTPDGKYLLLSSYGAGSGRYYSTYLTPTDGSPALRLGEGDAGVISHDAKWAVSIRLSNPPQLLLLPTGAGRPRVIPTNGIPRWASWMSDGRLVVRSNTNGSDVFAIFDPATGASTPIALMNVPGGQYFRISPDNKWIVTRDAKETMFIFSTNGGAAQRVSNISPNERTIGWASDDSVYEEVAKGSMFHVERVNVFTGKREPVRDIPLPDPTGSLGGGYLFLSRDGKTYATSEARILNDLYYVDGLR